MYDGTLEKSLLWNDAPELCRKKTDIGDRIFTAYESYIRKIFTSVFTCVEQKLKAFGIIKWNFFSSKVYGVYSPCLTIDLSDLWLNEPSFIRPGSR